MKIVGIGELLLNLEAKEYLTLSQATSFDVTYSGAEALVLASLARYKHNCQLLSIVPNNDIGQAMIDSVARFNIDTRCVLRKGTGLGFKFLSKPASLRAGQIITDCTRNAFSNAKVTDWNFERLFNGVNWLHLSASTIIANPNTKELILTALKAAKNSLVKVSMDLTIDLQEVDTVLATELLTPLLPYVNVCVCNCYSIEKLLDIIPFVSVHSTSQYEIDCLKDIMRQLYKKYDFDLIGGTISNQLENKTHLMGLVYDGTQFVQSKLYDILAIDNRGANQAFCAGIIHGVEGYKDKKQIADFATTAYAIKHTIQGQYNLASIQDIEKVMIEN